MFSYQPFHEKANSVSSALSIDPAQPKHAAQANPEIHCSSRVDFLFQESLLYTSIPMIRNVSTRISLRGQRRLIWVDTLRRVHTVGVLVERSYVVADSFHLERSVLSRCFIVSSDVDRVRKHGGIV